jgi:hypothetical protein
MLKIVAMAVSGLALALVGAAPASAEVVGSEELPYTCAEYAQIETDPGDWACFDDMLAKCSRCRRCRRQ